MGVPFKSMSDILHASRYGVSKTRSKYHTYPSRAEYAAGPKPGPLSRSALLTVAAAVIVAFILFEVLA